MTTALIDADTLVYKAAQRVERPIEWENGVWTLHAWPEEGIEQFHRILDQIVEEIEADEVVMVLTDYETPNWRYDVMPDYKSERQNSRKRRPILWLAMRRYIHEGDYEGLWDTYQWPGMEGDDVLGVLLTNPELIPGEKVCVSIDKDMHTLPGRHFNYDHPDHGVIELTEEEADLFHLTQAVAGDATDGYPGVPGVGMVRAERFLLAGLKLETYEHEFKRGARKGDTEFHTKPGEPGTMWEVALSIYEANGLTEEDALMNARVARICRDEDYDIEPNEVKLWTPPATKQDDTTE